MGLLALKIFPAIAFAGALLGGGLAHGADPFHRPLRIESKETAGRIAGEIHALAPHPFAVTAAALKEPGHWCEIMLLHLDTKDCAVVPEGKGTVVRIGVVTHYDKPASSAFHASFNYHVVQDTPAFMQVILDAVSGPLGTSNYRIVLEATPAEGERSSIHMSYSYSYGTLAKIAMEAYFATFGRGKVGFTEVGAEPDGKPRYIGGMRGVVERNTMRYYLAVEAYLDSLAVPDDARVEKSLRSWYSAVEQYPRQLHEMGEGEYLAMKRKEFAGRS